MSTFNALIQDLKNKISLNTEDARACCEFLVDSSNEDTLKKDCLSALHHKGESASELIGFAQCLQSKMTPIKLGEGIDLCGTGGSGKNRFNTSTAAAFVLSSMGRPVIKHGNKGSAKANGSFDFLDALNVGYVLSEEKQQSLFKRFHLSFLFARTYHPKVGELAPIRQSLGHKSIFNLLGPLLNPAQPPYHLLGVSNKVLAHTLAEALTQLSTQKTLIVMGHDGLDELSVTGTNTVLEVTQSGVSESSLNPKSVGLFHKDTDLPSFENSAESSDYFISFLQNTKPEDPIKDLITLNVGAARYVMGETPTVEDGIQKTIAEWDNRQILSFISDYQKATGA